MTDQRKQYTAEFKKEAVSLVLDKGYPVSEVAKNLGINETNIRRWINDIQTGEKQSHMKKTEQKPEEIKILEKKIRQLTMENEILKKATAFFAKAYSPDMNS
jgi:transposase